MPRERASNAALATEVYRPSLIVNGGFERWQRGAGPFTTTLAYTADRWKMTLVGTDTMSVVQDTTNVAPGSQSAAAVTFVLGTGAGASNIIQTIKTSDWHQFSNWLGSRPVSFAVAVRTTTPNAVRVALQDVSTTYYSGFHSGSGSYEILSVTVPSPAASTTILTPWILFAASCTAYLDNAMLVFGTVPADYIPLHPADELARCQRYYEILGETAGSIVWSASLAAASYTMRQTLFYKARKTVVPTVTKVGTWPVSNVGQPTVTIAGLDAAYVQAVITTGGVGDSYAYNGTAGNMFTVEANP